MSPILYPYFFKEKNAVAHVAWGLQLPIEDKIYSVFHIIPPVLTGNYKLPAKDMVSNLSFHCFEEGN
jgi:hypothetical protein